MEPKIGSEGKQVHPEANEGTNINPVALVLSVVGFAGSIIIVIGGGMLLSIHTPGLRAVGAIGDSYYHGLGLAIIGIGGIFAARCLWSGFRSLGGRWKRQ